MEIRIENRISVEEIERLKFALNEFFNTDFNVIIGGTYTYFREN